MLNWLYGQPPGENFTTEIEPGRFMLTHPDTSIRSEFGRPDLSIWSQLISGQRLFRNFLSQPSLHQAKRSARLQCSISGWWNIEKVCKGDSTEEGTILTISRVKRYQLSNGTWFRAGTNAEDRAELFRGVISSLIYVVRSVRCYLSTVSSQLYPATLVPFVKL